MQLRVLQVGAHGVNHLAGGVAAVSGFGIGSMLTPVLAIAAGAKIELVQR